MFPGIRAPRAGAKRGMMSRHHLAGESGALFRQCHEAATLKAAMIATRLVNIAPGVPR